MIYVDHTLHSARGHQPYILVVFGRVLNLWCELHNYIKLNSFLPMLVLAIATFTSIFSKCFCGN